ncbi:MAG: hypothetical protein AAGI23_20460 [Bacteroidota bacterium]
MKRLLYTFLLLALTYLSYAEGTRQLAPSSSDVAMLHIGDTNFGNFAYYNSLNKLFIEVKSNECIYLG